MTRNSPSAARGSSTASHNPSHDQFGQFSSRENVQKMLGQRSGMPNPRAEPRHHERKAMTHADDPTFGSPSGVYGTIASGETGWLQLHSS
jgi:hypothetical protein